MKADISSHLICFDLSFDASCVSLCEFVNFDLQNSLSHICCLAQLTMRTLVRRARITIPAARPRACTPKRRASRWDVGDRMDVLQFQQIRELMKLQHIATRYLQIFIPTSTVTISNHWIHLYQH